MSYLSHFEHLTHFSPSEFSRPDKISPQLLYRLDSARAIYGSPIRITSDYRPLDTTSSHSIGLAVDLACANSYNRFHLLHALIAAGFDRIGVYDLHIHVDIDKTRPSPVLWMGTSRPPSSKATS